LEAGGPSVILTNPDWLTRNLGRGAESLYPEGALRFSPRSAATINCCAVTRPERLPGLFVCG